MAFSWVFFEKIASASAGDFGGDWVLHGGDWRFGVLFLLEEEKGEEFGGSEVAWEVGWRGTWIYQ